MCEYPLKCIICGVETDEYYKYDAREECFYNNSLCPECAKDFYEPCDCCLDGYIQKRLIIPRLRFNWRMGFMPHWKFEKRSQWGFTFGFSIIFRKKILCPICRGTGNLKHEILNKKEEKRNG